MPSADGDAICILPQLKGLGGPASFAARLTAALQANGYRVHRRSRWQPGCAALLIMGGSRRLDLVWRARRRGVRIVQRLNGMNWVHRKLPTGFRHYLRAEVNNWILSTIRRWFGATASFTSASFRRIGGAESMGRSAPAAVYLQRGRPETLFAAGAGRTAAETLPPADGGRPPGRRVCQRAGKRDPAAGALKEFRADAGNWRSPATFPGAAQPAWKPAIPDLASPGPAWSARQASRRWTARRTCFSRPISTRPARIRWSRPWRAACR